MTGKRQLSSGGQMFLLEGRILPRLLYIIFFFWFCQPGQLQSDNLINSFSLAKCGACLRQHNNFNVLHHPKRIHQQSQEKHISADLSFSSCSDVTLGTM